jgi:ribosome-binding factor A
MPIREPRGWIQGWGNTREEQEETRKQIIARLVQRIPSYLRNSKIGVVSVTDMVCATGEAPAEIVEAFKELDAARKAVLTKWRNRAWTLRRIVPVKSIYRKR